MIFLPFSLENDMNSFNPRAGGGPLLAPPPSLAPAFSGPGSIAPPPPGVLAPPRHPHSHSHPRNAPPMGLVPTAPPPPFGLPHGGSSFPAPPPPAGLGLAPAYGPRRGGFPGPPPSNVVAGDTTHIPLLVQPPLSLKPIGLSGAHQNIHTGTINSPPSSIHPNRFSRGPSGPNGPNGPNASGGGLKPLHNRYQNQSHGQSREQDQNQNHGQGHNGHFNQTSYPRGGSGSSNPAYRGSDKPNKFQSSSSSSDRDGGADASAKKWSDEKINAALTDANKLRAFQRVRMNQQQLRYQNSKPEHSRGNGNVPPGIIADVPMGMNTGMNMNAGMNMGMNMGGMRNTMGSGMNINNNLNLNTNMGMGMNMNMNMNGGMGLNPIPGTLSAPVFIAPPMLQPMTYTQNVTLQRSQNNQFSSFAMDPSRPATFVDPKGFVREFRCSRDVYKAFTKNWEPFAALVEREYNQRSRDHLRSVQNANAKRCEERHARLERRKAAAKQALENDNDTNADKTMSENGENDNTEVQSPVPSSKSSSSTTPVVEADEDESLGPIESDSVFEASLRESEQRARHPPFSQVFTLDDIFRMERSLGISRVEVIYAFIRLAESYDVADLFETFWRSIDREHAETPQAQAMAARGRLGSTYIQQLANTVLPTRDAWFIHRACWAGDPRIVSLLVEAGAVTHCLNEYNEHPAEVVDMAFRDPSRSLKPRPITMRAIAAIKASLATSINQGFAFQQAQSLLQTSSQNTSISSTPTSGVQRSGELVETTTKGIDTQQPLQEGGNWWAGINARTGIPRHVFLYNIPFGARKADVLRWMQMMGTVTRFAVLKRKGESSSFSDIRMRFAPDHSGSFVFEFTSPEAVERAKTIDFYPWMDRNVLVSSEPLSSKKKARKLLNYFRANVAISNADLARARRDVSTHEATLQALQAKKAAGAGSVDEELQRASALSRELATAVRERQEEAFRAQELFEQQKETIMKTAKSVSALAAAAAAVGGVGSSTGGRQSASTVAQKAAQHQEKITKKVLKQAQAQERREKFLAKQQKAEEKLAKRTAKLQASKALKAEAKALKQASASAASAATVATADTASATTSRQSESENKNDANTTNDASSGSAMNDSTGSENTTNDKTALSSRDWTQDCVESADQSHIKVLGLPYDMSKEEIIALVETKLPRGAVVKTDIPMGKLGASPLDQAVRLALGYPIDAPDVYANKGRATLLLRSPDFVSELIAQLDGMEVPTKVYTHLKKLKDMKKDGGNREKKNLDDMAPTSKPVRFLRAFHHSKIPPTTIKHMEMMLQKQKTQENGQPSKKVKQQQEQEQDQQSNQEFESLIALPSKNDKNKPNPHAAHLSAKYKQNLRSREETDESTESLPLAKRPRIGTETTKVSQDSSPVSPDEKEEGEVEDDLEAML